METVNPLGTIFNRSENETKNKSNNHNLYLSLQSQYADNSILGNISNTFGGNTGNNLSSSAQSGLIKQNLNILSLSEASNSNIYAGFNLSRRLNKKGRMASLGITSSTANTHNASQLNNQIGYFNPSTGEALKDSILNQLVDTRNRSLS